MSDTIDQIDPPTSPPRSVVETTPSNLNPTPDIVMAVIEDVAGVSIDQPHTPSKEDVPDVKSARRGRERVKIHDIESDKDLPTYQHWRLLKKNETLCIDRLVFKKDVEEDDERLRKYLVRKNNNVAKKMTKTKNNHQLREKDANINNFSLREKDANINDLSDQMREKDEIIENLRNEH